jgi:hypothetical protein
MIAGASIVLLFVAYVSAQSQWYVEALSIMI